MKRRFSRAMRFGWRLGRNLACALPGGTSLLFPPESLAQRFGRGDASYAIRVYHHHASQLAQAGFTGAARIFETGPGRNLGSALLWWCRAYSEELPHAKVTLWDVHANADPTQPLFWSSLAREILAELEQEPRTGAYVSDRMLAALADVGHGARLPVISYLVCPLSRLVQRLADQRFDLVLSHAALEHVWHIADYWRNIAALTAPNGWHSHRIDLADHGRRSSNYLEMLEWSSVSWWMTMRFVPGAINRWRAWEHRAAIEYSGLKVLYHDLECRPALPVPRMHLAAPYHDLPEQELLATAVDLVACRPDIQCAC